VSSERAGEDMIWYGQPLKTKRHLHRARLVCFVIACLPLPLHFGGSSLALLLFVSLAFCSLWGYLHEA
jgi:hypothetical protein